ncbi:hypothetical protein [Spirobacillus cienkowskii]|jgi:hypothetical protein|uniref:Uncharacterized protein n=1 Tax=Spirobacillus cienkowskii TaxID=495820 RepID=A0A369KSF4_9BACT|nr:MAG: hypothetical protein DCC88_04450 [Spirobacillus cienkowskii]
MFQIKTNQQEYHYDSVTVIDNLLQATFYAELKLRVNHIINSNSVPLVNHSGLGNDLVKDKVGKYCHHIFKGSDIKKYLPELNSFCHGIVPLISSITLKDAIVSLMNKKFRLYLTITKEMILGDQHNSMILFIMVSNLFRTKI